MRLLKVSHFFAELGNSPIFSIVDPVVIKNGVHLDIKRDDLLHPVISGNKWRKLKHLLLHIESRGFKKIAAMGGPYSNLLHALSYIGYRLGWSVELWVRGYPEQALTPTLLDATKWGATIRYVNRVEFRELREQPPHLDGDVFWIPEGGFHELALKGTVESLMEVNSVYDFVLLATATGTSLAGLSLGAKYSMPSTKVVGISVLNNAEQVLTDINELLPQPIRRPELISGYEFGGYAKSSSKLDQFINDFKRDHDIALEPVYSGKSFFATIDLVNKGYFPRGSRVLLIHCGGLQGNRKTEKSEIGAKSLTLNRV